MQADDELAEWLVRWEEARAADQLPPPLDQLPAELRPRIAELTPGQLVALRFAADDEVGALAEKALREGIRDRDAIKRMIRSWRADNLRV